MTELVTVARTGEIPEGRGLVVAVGAKLLAVFNAGGRFYALDNTCLHRGGPLGDGDLEDTTLTCPWHGWQYDVTSGEHLLDRSVGVRSYPVEVEGDEIRVRVG